MGEQETWGKDREGGRGREIFEKQRGEKGREGLSMTEKERKGGRKEM